MKQFFISISPEEISIEIMKTNISCEIENGVCDLTYLQGMLDAQTFHKILHELQKRTRGLDFKYKE